MNEQKNYHGFRLKEVRDFNIPKGLLIEEKSQTRAMVSDILGHWIYHEVPLAVTDHIRKIADGLFDELVKEENRRAVSVQVRLKLECAQTKGGNTWCFKLVLTLHKRATLFHSFFGSKDFVNIVDSRGNEGTFHVPFEVKEENSQSGKAKMPSKPTTYIPQYQITTKQAPTVATLLLADIRNKHAVDEYANELSTALKELGYATNWVLFYRSIYEHAYNMMLSLPDALQLYSSLCVNSMGEVYLANKLSHESGEEQTDYFTLGMVWKNEPKMGVAAVTFTIDVTQSTLHIHDHLSRAVKNMLEKQDFSLGMFEYTEDSLFRISRRIWCEFQKANTPTSGTRPHPITGVVSLHMQGDHPMIVFTVPGQQYTYPLPRTDIQYR